jgi:hypothetical protein
MVHHMSRDRSISVVALVAGLLLLVLVAHLSFMASPFHWVMLEQGEDHHAAMVAGVNTPHAEHRSFGVQHPVDCVIQWAPPPRASLIAVLIATPTIGWMSDDLASTRITRPLARANGPPSGDRQALLQVFRL